MRNSDNCHYRNRVDYQKIQQIIICQQVEEMETFSEIHNLPRLNPEETENLN